MVSIHAPAKGATRPRDSAYAGGAVSIHAPAKGATSPKTMPCLPGTQFQSTPPRRGRPKIACLAKPAQRVSIHAPAKGATSSAHARCSPWPCFNPRPREGGDGFVRHG